jgi:diguanylate cyclase (GGDEF)-like protein/PAS domain S-box-containing protein
MFKNVTHAVFSRLKRMDAALMPDYNRKARIYWWTMVVLGSASIAYALVQVAGLNASTQLQILAGMSLAIVAGFFPVQIPGSKNTFMAGEVFIFLLLFMFGVPAAVLATTGEGLVGVIRSSKRWSSRIASPCMSAVSMITVGSALDWALQAARATGLYNAGVLLLATSAAALLYFLLQSVLVTSIFLLKTSGRFDLKNHLQNFGSVGITYAGSALLAALLYLAVQYSGVSVLLGALPVVAMLLTTLHYFLRQQDAQEEARRGRSEAAEREKQQLARHMDALRESERRFHSAFTHASIGMTLVSFEGRILQANQALLSLLGRTESTSVVDSVVDHQFADFVVTDDRPGLDQAFNGIRDRSIETFAIEVRCAHQQGAQLWVALNGSFFNEADADTPCLILQVQDISARRHAETQLNHIAFHDGLTGLPNRSRFISQLKEALVACHEDPTHHFSVMFLDFDRFKLINDSMGHSAGDEFLIQVSRRIQDHVRPGDVVARLGGDEFAILTHQVGSEAAAMTLADRLQIVLKQPLQVGGMSVATSASIGITFSNLGYSAPDELLRDADIAMYRAKTSGKARYAVFDATLHTEVARRVRLESDLRQALIDGQLEVAYQPMYNLASNGLRGFEALARWRHPTLGDIAPTTFIPIAEETGLIIELTDQLMMKACKQVRTWQRRSASTGDLKLQFNLSSNDLAHSALAERIEHVLVSTQFEARLLTLELTENILMERVEGAMPALETLRRIGVSLAIDDFGTGYSSLSYLSTLPIDSLKIDRSFVHGMRDGKKDVEIVRGIISLGTSLGKSIVAEGIETNSQLGQLRELGCEYGQGWQLSRPLTPQEVDLLLDSVVTEEESLEGVSSQAMPLLRH